MTKDRNLLKEAIADAKIVKETAIKNAKIALEEAFTPFLKEKLSAKLAEMDNEELNEMENEEEFEDFEETSEENEFLEETEEVEETESLVNEEEDDFDLDELLRELEETEETEENLNEAEEAEVEEEVEEEDEDFDVENMSEDDLKGFIEGVISDMVNDGELEGNLETEEEEEVEDIAEIKAIEEMKKRKSSNIELTKTKAELKEALQTLAKVKKDLSEVNLLNSKLLYTTKIFKNKTLNENQKIKVLTAFDKVTTVKEAKLIYETLNNIETTPTKKNLRESIFGGSSRTIATTQTKAPIVEIDQQFARWQKLAGIN